MLVARVDSDSIQRVERRNFGTVPILWSREILSSQTCFCRIERSHKFLPAFHAFVGVQPHSVGPALVGRHVIDDVWPWQGEVGDSSWWACKRISVRCEMRSACQLATLG